MILVDFIYFLLKFGFKRLKSRKIFCYGFSQLNAKQNTVYDVLIIIIPHLFHPFGVDLCFIWIGSDKLFGKLQQ